MADCEEEKFYTVADTFGGVKPVPSCNPAKERIPDELREPEGSLDNPRVYRVPEPVLVFNVQQDVTCQERYDGQRVYGLGSVVPDGAYTSVVDLSLIGQLTAEQLDYIASKDLSARMSRLFHAYVMEGTPEEEVVAGIATLFRITADKAALVYDALSSEQDRLDYEARTQAEASLECYWMNYEAEATCWDNLPEWADREFATRDDHKDAVVEYFVPDGLIRSDISQDDADMQAKVMAESGLNCFYVSSPVDVACTDPDRPGKPDGGGDVPVPVEKEAVVANMPPRNGRVFIPKGMYTSVVSRADATATARNYAYSLLVCYYFNDYTRRTCGLPDARGIGIDPLLQWPEEADTKTRTSGQSAVVPYGTIISNLSPADANATAASIAESVLECCFISPEASASCPVIEVVDEHGHPVLEPDGSQVVVRPLDKADYAVPRYTVPRGEFTGCVSSNLTDEEANEKVRQELEQRAEDAANAGLTCIYCNRQVLPSCVPEWVIKAVTTGFETPSGSIYRLSLPLNPDEIINPYTGEKEDFSKWSKDATVGFMEDYFCAEDYYSAQRLADSEGIELLSDKIDKGADMSCTFGNCIVHAACMAENIYTKDECQGSTVTTGRYKRYYMETGERSEACGGGEYIWLSAKKWGSKCAVSSESNPPPCEYITVDPDTIKVTIDETPGTIPIGEPGYSYDDNARKARGYANRLAMDLAISSMCCKQPPATVVGYCAESTEDSKTATLHGLYSDMPKVLVESDSEVDDDLECAGCNRTFYVVKHHGLEQLVDYSPVEAAPIIMDWTPQGCFNAEPYKANKEQTHEQGKRMSLQDIINTVRSLVVCLYGNAEVEGWCAAPEDIGSDDEPPEVVSDSFKLPENTIIADSWYSAQITAELLADAIVNCSYGNITVKAECSCNKGEYKDQLEKWEYLRQIVPFKCGKVKANTVFASSVSLAKKIALGLAELITVCRIKPCEDLTPFKVRYKCKPEDPCDDIKNKKKREECKRKEKDREKDYSDCILRMNHGMVYLSNGTVVDCPCIEYMQGTTGKLSVRIKKEVGTGDYKCVHLVNGKEVEEKECEEEDKEEDKQQ